MGCCRDRFSRLVTHGPSTLLHLSSGSDLAARFLAPMFLDSQGEYFQHLPKQLMHCIILATCGKQDDLVGHPRLSAAWSSWGCRKKMNTDKLQALHDTVAEILSEPPSPPTFFDEEPHEAEQAGEKVAKASDNFGLGTEIPKENFGKIISRKFGNSPNAFHDAHVVRDVKNESVGIARQALADQIHVAPLGDAGNQRPSKLSQETASPLSDPPTSINLFPTADSSHRIPLGKWTVRGFAVVLLAAGIGVATFIWLGSSVSATGLRAASYWKETPGKALFGV